MGYRVLSNNIKYLFSYILKYLPLKYIIFESNPDFSDNTNAVFKEFLNRNLNHKYKLIWLCRDKKSIKKFDILGVKAIDINNRWKKLCYLTRAKCIISCNSYIPKSHDRQISIYLGHGIALKSMNTYEAPPNIDYFIGLSPDANNIMSSAFKTETNKFVITGYPRNDELFHDKKNKIKQIFKGKYDKIIIWYPTYRQHKNKNVISASQSALPIIHNEENVLTINRVAKEKNILILIKPHFSQDIKSIKNMKLSNIVLINDEFFIQNNISSYEFVGSCDALITDYSSIYFDYLLCDKPIAAIWEDIEEYRRNRGFCVDIDYWMKGSYKIYDLSQFTNFINTVSENKDTMKLERTEINNKINYYQDQFSTKRVVDFIESIL